MPKTNSRQKILNYLRKQAVATPIELGKALRLTPSNIRHHLSRLAADGLVEVGGLRFAQGRGRPHKLYRLSRLALGDNLATLASVLFSDWVDSQSQTEQLVLMRRLAAKLSPVPPLERSASLTRRLAATVDVLNQMRYQAHWEAHATGPRLILGQCPYAAIIAQHSALCLLDQALLETQLSRQVEQLAKLEINDRGVPVCLFQLLSEIPHWLD